MNTLDEKFWIKSNKHFRTIKLQQFKWMRRKLEKKYPLTENLIQTQHLHNPHADITLIQIIQTLSTIMFREYQFLKFYNITVGSCQLKLATKLQKEK